MDFDLAAAVDPEPHEPGRQPPADAAKTEGGKAAAPSRPAGSRDGGQPKEGSWASSSSSSSSSDSDQEKPPGQQQEEEKKKAKERKRQKKPKKPKKEKKWSH